MDDCEDLEDGKERQTRGEKYRYNRLDMEEHFEMCRRTKCFQRRYHMSEESFFELVGVLESEGLAVDLLQSKRSTGGNEPITTVMIVALGLRFMGGEMVKSLADVFGMSDKSAERVINKFLDAVDNSTNT